MFSTYLFNSKRFSLYFSPFSKIDQSENFVDWKKEVSFLTKCMRDIESSNSSPQRVGLIAYFSQPVRKMLAEITPQQIVLVF